MEMCGLKVNMWSDMLTDGTLDRDSQHTLVDHTGKYWAGCLEPGSGQPAGESRLSNAE